MIHSTERFLETLPHTHVNAHIGQVHAALLFLHRRSGAHDDVAVQIAEHSLRCIAAASFTPLTPGERYVGQRRRAEDIDVARVGASVREAFSGLTDALANMRKGMGTLSERSAQAAESLREADYRRMLRNERIKAKMHLTKEVARVRRELGLIETGEK